MASRLKNYLRFYRRRSGLTQRELAYLLGLSDSAISRIERNLSQPTLKIALACQVLFGASPFELFPDAFAQVEETVKKRGAKLHERLQAGVERNTKAKSDFLRGLLAAGNSNTEV
jgi:transcriptional regulator with XRE-family HTH domain